MSIFVFRSQSSTGARELADALGGRRLRRFEGGRFYGRREGVNPVNVRAGDTIVCWGAALPNPPAGVKVLNGAAIHNKFTDASALRAAGVATIEVQLARPADVVEQAPVDPAIQLGADIKELAEDFSEAQVVRNDVYRNGIDKLVADLIRLEAMLRGPAPQGRRVPAGDWVGRDFNHTGGTDLLNPPANPDYWVKRVQLVKEYRIHSFGGRSIRAGVKTLRDGFRLPDSPANRNGANASPWVRSYDGGWKIDYNDFKSKAAMRELAASAVKALGLDFGAVDIGEKADRSLIVLEVNRAPGLEGGTVNAYSGAIEQFSRGAWAPAAPRQARRRAA